MVVTSWLEKNKKIFVDQVKAFDGKQKSPDYLRCSMIAEIYRGLLNGDYQVNKISDIKVDVFIKDNSSRKEQDLIGHSREWCDLANKIIYSNDESESNIETIQRYFNLIQGNVKNASRKIINYNLVMNPTNYQEGVKRLSKRIQDEWKNQTENFLADIKEELSILKLVSNEKQEIQKILACLNNFSNWPDNENITIQYDIASQKAKEILSRMEFDDEIAQFLKKVKNKEATLLDLSDSIIAWIRKENLSENIILGIKS